MLHKNLKVLLLSPLPPPAGGIASWTEQFLEWANKNDLSIDLVNTAVVGNRAEKINSNISILDEIKRSYYIIKELKKKINQFEPQIIHLNTPCGKFGIVRDFFCAQITYKKNISLVVHYRCNIEDQVDSSIISKFFLKKLSNIANLNLVLNNSSNKYLKIKTKCNGVMIANFINDAFVVDQKKYIREEIKMVSFVGHIQRTKGIYEILETARMFPEITFKLAGPVANEINKKEIPSNINFLGSIAKNEVKKLLLESDVFLFPSYTEGFANAMLEAMALGVPILATPVGANSDMIESSGGFIVEVGNAKSIYEKINMMRDSNVRFEMSNWNINKVKNEYTINRVMSKLVTLYLKEVQQKSGGNL